MLTKQYIPISLSSKFLKSTFCFSEFDCLDAPYRSAYAVFLFCDWLFSRDLKTNRSSFDFKAE